MSPESRQTRAVLYFHYPFPLPCVSFRLRFHLSLSSYIICLILHRAPFASTTCAPSVPHGSVGSMGASGARSACTSLIFIRCASPPGTARATLRALLRPARAPRGSTCGPRGAGGPSGPWESTRTCSAVRRPLEGGLLPLLPPKVKIQKCCHARPLQVPRGRGTRTLCCPQ